MDGVWEPAPLVTERHQRTQIVLDQCAAPRLTGPQLQKRIAFIEKKGLPVAVRYQHNRAWTQTRILLVPRAGFKHLTTRRHRRKYLQKKKFYHISISYPTEWPKFWWKRGQVAFNHAWQRERSIPFLMRTGFTRLRVLKVHQTSCVAFILLDDQLKLPLDVIGAQRVTVGGHCYMSTVSL